MTHDFANQRDLKKKSTKRKARTKTRTTKPKPKQTSHGSAFCSGLLTGLFVSFIIYLSFIKPNTVANQPVVLSPSPITVSTDNSPTTDFDFYKKLRDAEVLVNVELVEIASEQETAQLSYQLQAGAFRDQQDAESHRAQIILLNMPARIAPAVTKGKTWYRVLVGPFTGRSAANDARETLSTNNIDSIILLIK